MIMKTIQDNGGRRLGIERRLLAHNTHIPERRSDQDRRIVPDRRSGMDRRSAPDRREGQYISPTVLEMRKVKDRRVLVERRAAFA